MNNERLEQAQAWVEAIELAAFVYNLTSVASEAFAAKDSLKQQLEQAALSVSNGIAAAFPLPPNDLVQGLQRAQSSAMQVRSMLCLVERFPAFGSFGPLLADVKSKCDRCSSELQAWIGSAKQGATNGHPIVDHAREEERRRIAREKRAVFEGLRQMNGA
jgi:four helix bundle protein